MTLKEINEMATIWELYVISLNATPAKLRVLVTLWNTIIGCNSAIY